MYNIKSNGPRILPWGLQLGQAEDPSKYRLHTRLDSCLIGTVDRYEYRVNLFNLCKGIPGLAIRI